MKKVLLMAIGLIAGTTMFAQDDAAKKMWIGGTAGFTSGGHADENDATNDYSSTGWNFGPSFAYMLNDKMAVGINLGITGSSMKFEDGMDSKSSSTGYDIQPFFRYYFAGADKFKFYSDLRVGFGGETTKYEDNTVLTYDDSKSSTFDVGVYAGAQYWFNPGWSMAADIGVLGFESMTGNIDEVDGAGKSKEYTDSSFGLVGNFAVLNFSMFYHF